MEFTLSLSKGHIRLNNFPFLTVQFEGHTRIACWHAYTFQKTMFLRKGVQI